VLLVLLGTYGLLGLWSEGRKRDLIALVAGLTGMVLTKETYVIHSVAWPLAFLCLWLWQCVVPSRPAYPFTAQQWGWREMATSLLTGMLVIVTFYSGFLLDFAAVSGLWETFEAWFTTGVKAGGHEKLDFQWGILNFYWLALMARYEWAGLIGVLACFLLLAPTDARMRYLAIYGGGVLLGYSLIPYKTPWCIISLLWPFFFTAAWLIWRLPKWVAVAAALTLSVVATYQSIALNFFRATDDTEPYVYVQTHHDIGRAIDPILEKAKADPTFYHAPGRVILESYYPIPWMLGDFTGVGYYGTGNVPNALFEHFVICQEEDAQEVRDAFQGDYIERTFRLRSGLEDCHVFFRKSSFPELEERE